MHRSFLDQYDKYFAERVFEMRSSAMRDLMAITQRPDVISLAGGLPDTGAFDREFLSQMLSSIARDFGPVALQYGSTEGLNAMIDVIIDVMAVENMSATASEILVTTGGQQGLDLFARTMIDPGDVVIAEGPTYPGVVPCFSAVQADVRQIPLDHDGLDPVLVEQELVRAALEGKPAKYIYTIPTFQNPGGCTTSLERRHELVRIANKHDVIILEDNPYALLRYEGEPLPTLRSLDTERRVVYLGTFSKMFSPGVRLGWLEAPAPIFARLNLMKQAADLCSSPLTQLLVSEFFRAEEGQAWRRWVKQLTDSYRIRRDAMTAAIDTYFPSDTSYTLPAGGLFLWATIPGVDTTELLKVALEEKVAFVPGRAAFVDGSGSESMRLNFSAMRPEQIEEGIARIGAAVKTAAL